MPAQFFQATDDKPTGTAAAYREFMTFMQRNEIPFSAGLSANATKGDIQDALGEIWDGIGSDIPAIRSHVTNTLNINASDEEIALFAFFILRQKFTQYGSTLPGGGG